VFSASFSRAFFGVYDTVAVFSVAILYIPRSAASSDNTEKYVITVAVSQLPVEETIEQ
jgi:hypothetical protein